MSQYWHSAEELRGFARECRQSIGGIVGAHALEIQADRLEAGQPASELRGYDDPYDPGPDPLADLRAVYWAAAGAHDDAVSRHGFDHPVTDGTREAFRLARERFRAASEALGDG